MSWFCAYFSFFLSLRYSNLFWAWAKMRSNQFNGQNYKISKIQLLEMSKGYQVVVAHDGWVGSRWSARLPYPQAQTGNRGDRRMGQGEHWTRGNCGKKENWSRQYPFRLCGLARQFLLHKIVFKRCKNRVLIIWILLFTPSWVELAAKTDKLWIKHIKCNIVIVCGKKKEKYVW